jgi:hypothetical protein
MFSMTVTPRLLFFALAALAGCGGDLVLPAPSGQGEPDTLRAASPLNQSGRRGEVAEDSPTVVVVDRVGNPVAGAEIRWEVTAGEGQVSGGTAADAEGRATATWTLGDKAGAQKLEARVEGAHGSPVTFQALVLF